MAPPSNWKAFIPTSGLLTGPSKSAFMPAMCTQRSTTGPSQPQRHLLVHAQTQSPGRRSTLPRTQPTSQLGSPSTQIGRPKTSIKKDVGNVTEQRAEPQADAEKGSAKAKPRRKTQADEVPMYKVILLADEEYVEAHVVTQLQKTVQITKNEATRIFHEAQASGSSIICVVCEEHAEFYAQQLKRADIFVIIEKDE